MSAVPMVEPPWITEGRNAALAETLPPWFALNERDAKQMFEWVKRRLDQWDKGLWAPSDTIWPSDEQRRQMREQTRAALGKADQWRREGGLERQAARRGDIRPALELIRKLKPQLADLVQLPPLARGRRRDPITVGGVPVPPGDKKPSGYWVAVAEHRKLVAEAAADVKRIRVIWDEFFGKTNRRKGDGPSALDMAAERHGVTPDEIVKFLKG